MRADGPGRGRRDAPAAAAAAHVGRRPRRPAAGAVRRRRAALPPHLLAEPGRGVGQGRPPDREAGQPHPRRPRAGGAVSAPHRLLYALPRTACLAEALPRPSPGAPAARAGDAPPPRGCRAGAPAKLCARVDRRAARRHARSGNGFRASARVGAATRAAGAVACEHQREPHPAVHHRGLPGPRRDTGRAHPVRARLGARQGRGGLVLLRRRRRGPEARRRRRRADGRPLRALDRRAGGVAAGRSRRGQRALRRRGRRRRRPGRQAVGGRLLGGARPHPHARPRGDEPLAAPGRRAAVHLLRPARPRRAGHGAGDAHAPAGLSRGGVPRAARARRRPARAGADAGGRARTRQARTPRPARLGRAGHRGHPS